MALSLNRTTITILPRACCTEWRRGRIALPSPSGSSLLRSAMLKVNFCAWLRSNEPFVRSLFRVRTPIIENSPPKGELLSMAEGEGFEPSIGLKPIPPFQDGALDQLCDPSFVKTRLLDDGSITVVLNHHFLAGLSSQIDASLV